MKKVVMLVLALVMVGAVALAEVDLSGMTFDELVALRKQVDQAIWASDGWQEVEVPGGEYEVGPEIPAGKWTVSADSLLTMMEVYSSEEKKGSFDGLIDSKVLSNNEPYNVTLKEGQYVTLSDAVTFKPYTSAALGFK